MSLRAFRMVLVALATLPLIGVGCRSRDPVSEPEGKVRLQKLLRLYTVYVERNKKGPPDEQALRDLFAKLSEKERDELLIGDDLDSLFTGARDGQKHGVRYGVPLDPGMSPQAIAWEAAGKKGMRFVALSTGYVEEYDDETFREYKK